MDMSRVWLDPWQGWIEGGVHLVIIRAEQSRLSGLERFLNQGFDLIQSHPGGFDVGFADTSDAFLNVLEQPFFGSQKPDSGFFESVRIRGGLERPLGVVGQIVQCGNEFLQGHRSRQDG